MPAELLHCSRLRCLLFRPIPVRHLMILRPVEVIVLYVALQQRSHLSLHPFTMIVPSQLRGVSCINPNSSRRSGARTLLA